MFTTDQIKTRLHEMLIAYNTGNTTPFEAFVSDNLAFKDKVLDEIKSGRAGKVDTFDVVVEGCRAAEYWVERGMRRNGEVIPEIWGVNVYTFDADGVIVDFLQLEEARMGSSTTTRGMGN